ncbi:hypothetical protein GRI89_12040 [Altererythrobacter salegens]|uniref:Uncharacterized protein n=1 Tax=Croceibacterium salegens TaxID=1737568 RepID=A0A6I4SXW3_9SPHN|nr:hypothetical protein [Croceibacterium salegens]MXO60268.1 hypothetical protein [Croceibacterium salegens]
MAERVTRQLVAEKATVYTELPVHAPTIVDRTFELPKSLYAITVAMYLGFLAVMAIGFRTPEMILPMAAFVVSIVAGFGIPTIWSRLNPPTESKPKSWARFAIDGIQTAYGKTAARDAAVQVLILPVLIFAWGVAVVTIAAVVR